MFLFDFYTVSLCSSDWPWTLYSSWTSWRRLHFLPLPHKMHPTTPGKKKAYFILKGCLAWVGREDYDRWTLQLQRFWQSWATSDPPLKRSRTAFCEMSSLQMSANTRWTDINLPSCGFHIYISRNGLCHNQHVSHNACPTVLSDLFYWTGLGVISLPLHMGETEAQEAVRLVLVLHRWTDGTALS